jgi:hypothetical protein
LFGSASRVRGQTPRVVVLPTTPRRRRTSRTDRLATGAATAK